MSLSSVICLLALVAHIIGILPHGVFKWFVVKLRGRRSYGITFGLVLVLQSHLTLALSVLIQLSEGCDHIFQVRMRYWFVLWLAMDDVVKEDKSQLTSQMEQNMNRKVILGPDQRLVRAR